MKKILFFAFVFFTTNLIYSQIHLQNIYEISKLKYDEVKSYMSDNLGFKEIKSIDNIDSHIYEFYNGVNNLEGVIYIKIISPIKSDMNIIILRIGNEENVKKIKSALISDGFVYDGKRQMKPKPELILSSYKKNDVCFFITDQRNSNSFYEIDIFKLEE